MLPSGEGFAQHMFKAVCPSCTLAVDKEAIGVARLVRALVRLQQATCTELSYGCSESVFYD